MLMKKYNSLEDLKSNITQKKASNFDNITVSLLQLNQILIEVKTTLIGDAENAFFLRIYNWMQREGLSNHEVYILLPDNFERFSPVFISTLYLFNQSLQSQFVILGHHDNSRTYEFTQLANSGLLSKNDLIFFTIASYSDENSPLFPFSQSNTKAIKKHVVSEKNLPLISIDADNFNFYFKHSVKDIFNKPFDDYLDFDEMKTYDTLRNSFHLWGYNSPPLCGG